MVEGDSVFAEAIEYLNSLPSLQPLQWDENLALSAMEHVLDIGPKGLLSYQSSDGAEPEERISKYGNYIDSLGENIDFGPNDVLGVIISLTLDDGESDRPHRENLFKSDYQKIGIACGPHKTEYHMCVMDFAYDFSPLNDDSHDIHNSKQKTAVVPNNGISNSNYPIDANNSNQSPLVRLLIDEELKPTRIEDNKNNFLNPEDEELWGQIKGMNLKKKVVSKYVEVQTRIVFTFEDGSTKEVSEKQNHTFDFR